MTTEKRPKNVTSTKTGPEIPLFPLDRSPGRMIYRAHVAMRSGLLRILRNSGFELSVEEWVILSSLWEYGEMTQPELGARVGKDRHFVSRLLDSLASRHLVQRKGTTSDRRINRVQLTAQGERARTVLLAALTEFFDQVFSGVSQAQYETFMRCLDTIVAWHARQQGHLSGADARPSRTVEAAPQAIRRKHA